MLAKPMIFLDLFLTIRAALTRFWTLAAMRVYALRNLAWFYWLMPYKMVVALLVRVLLSNLIKTRPNNNLPFLTTFLMLFRAGNYGNHTGKIGYDIYSTYLLFRPLLL